MRMCMCISQIQANLTMAPGENAEWRRERRAVVALPSICPCVLDAFLQNPSWVQSPIRGKGLTRFTWVQDQDQDQVQVQVACCRRIRRREKEWILVAFGGFVKKVK